MVRVIDRPCPGYGEYCVFGYRGERPTGLHKFPTREQADQFVLYCLTTPGLDGWERFAVHQVMPMETRVSSRLIADVHQAAKLYQFVHGSVDIKGLAGQMGKSRAAVHQAVNELQKRGLAWKGKKGRRKDNWFFE